MRSKKGDGIGPMEVIIGIVILAAIAYVLIHTNVISVGGSKMRCNVNLGIAEGDCITNDETCVGVAYPLGKGCPEDKPICCVKKTGATATGSKTPAKSDAAQPSTGETALKGSVKFYCKCKIDNGYLVASDTYAAFDASQALKVKKGAELEMQARGTEDITFCRLAVGEGEAEKVTEGACNKDSGPEIKFKFGTEAPVNIHMTGFQKEKGSEINKLLLNIKVEKIGLFGW